MRYRTINRISIKTNLLFQTCRCKRMDLWSVVPYGAPWGGRHRSLFRSGLSCSVRCHQWIGFLEDEYLPRTPRPRSEPVSSSTLLWCRQQLPVSCLLVVRFGGRKICKELVKMLGIFLDELGKRNWRTTSENAIWIGFWQNVFHHYVIFKNTI